MNPLGLCLSYTSMITLEHGLSANQTTSPSSETTADGTQEDSSTVPAPDNKHGSTPETKKRPAKKPVLKIIRRTVTSDQGGATQKISDNSKGEFSIGGPGSRDYEALTVPTVATMKTMAVDNAASQLNTLDYSSGPIATQVPDPHPDNLSDADFIFQGMSF